MTHQLNDKPIDRRSVIRGTLGAVAAGAVASSTYALTPAPQDTGGDDDKPKKDICVYKFTKVTAPDTCEKCSVKVGFIFCAELECELAADCPANLVGTANCLVGTGDCKVELGLKGCFPCPTADGGGGGGAFGRLETYKAVGKLTIETDAGQMTGTILAPTE